MLRGLVGEAPIHGVRVVALRLPTLPAPDWLDDPRTFPFWDALAGYGLPAVVTLLPPDLERLRPVLRTFPDVPVAIDHCGFVEIASGPSYPALAPLAELAPFPNLHVKLSSHNLLDASAGGGDPGGLVAELVSVFGAHRVVWGSDHPQTAGADYAALVDLGRRSVSVLPEPAQDAVLGGNAVRLWPVLAERGGSGDG